MTAARRLRVMGAAGVVVLIVAWFAWGRLAKRTPPVPPPPPYAFDMCILHAHTAPTHPVWTDPVLSAVARTLSPAERAPLEDALASAATRWEATANPLLDDLEGGDPDAALIAWFKKGPSFLRTAQAAAKLKLCTPDGFCVAPRTKNAACPSESTPPASADEADRARFILWPWGHALRFRASSPEAARAAAETLRTQVPSSRTFAVVMTAEDAEITKAPPFVTLRERWTKVASLKRIAHHDKSTPTAGFTVDELADEVIVLPRLEAIAAGNPDALVARDVLAAAPQLSAR